MVDIASELQVALDKYGVPYNSLNGVSRNLQFHGRSLEHVQKAAADMDAYLRMPNLPGDILPVDHAKMKEVLEWTIHSIQKFNETPHEIPHHIVWFILVNMKGILSCMCEGLEQNPYMPYAPCYS
jgi:hypothetical protein